jgi:hypothetical protein
MDDKPPAKSVDYENLEFHQLANMFPLIEGDEFDAFVDAFRRQGLLTPITLYEGKILDGRNRYRAVKKIGYKLVAKDFVDLPPGKDPREFVIAANVQRLHLTTEQKKELAIRLIRERPNDSDRKIALLIGVSDKTVSAYRNELQQRYDKFVEAWGNLDAAQRRDFVTACRCELVQAEVSNRRQGDREYFRKLRKHIDEVGAAAMLYDLRRRDLGDWHPRDIPEELLHGAGLQKQQSLALPPWQQWFVSLLHAGRLPGANAKRPNFAKTRTLLADAQKRYPRLKWKGDTDIGNFLTELGCEWDHTRVANGYEFPPLAECRAEWARKYGPQEWGKAVEEWEGPC